MQAEQQQESAAISPRSPKPRAWLHRRRLFQFHGWLGISFGLVLFIVCFSGAAAALSHEIDWLLNPAIRVSPQGSSLGWNQWRQAAEQARPDWKIRWITAPMNRYFAAEVVTEAPSGLIRRIYINPYTGVVQGTTSFFNVQRFLRDFHRLLNLSNTGIYIVSFFGFVLMSSVTTGFVFYKNWWRNLFQLRIHKGRRAFWSDVHRFAGVWSLLFSLVIAVTGIWYFVEHVMYQTGYLQEAPPVIESEQLSGQGPMLQVADLDRLVRRAQHEIPHLDVRNIWFPLTLSDTLRIDGQARTLLVRDRANEVHFDPYTGNVLQTQKGEDLTALNRFQDMADPLHFGDFGGLFTKVLWSVLGMALPVMILSGSYLALRESGGWPKPSFRPWRWTLWSWMSVALLLTSVLASTEALRRYSTPRTPAFTRIGQFNAGPWRLELAAGASQIRGSFGARTRVPKLQFMEATLNDGKPVRFRPKGNLWFSGKLNSTDAPLQNLTVTLRDIAGDVHTAQVTLRRSALKGTAASILDEGPDTGPGVWWFLGLLIAIMTAVTISWLAFFANRPQKRKV